MCAATEKERLTSHRTWKRKMTTLDSRKSEEAAVAIHEAFQMEAQEERGEEGRGEGDGERVCGGGG